MNKETRAAIERYNKNWVNIVAGAKEEGDWQLEYYGEGAMEAVRYMLHLMNKEN